jgi:hypothetical protein
MNLQCINSIVDCFPKTNLQPPPNFRSLIEKVQEFMAMAKEVQREAKRTFQALSERAKQEFIRGMPGEDCSCCTLKRKARSDRGKRHGAKKRRSACRKGNRSASNNDAPLLANSTVCSHLRSQGRIRHRELDTWKIDDDVKDSINSFGSQSWLKTGDGNSIQASLTI